MNLFSYATDHKKLAGIITTVHAIFSSCAIGAGVVMYFVQHWTAGFDLQAFCIGLGAAGVSISANVALLKLGGSSDASGS